MNEQRLFTTRVGEIISKDLISLTEGSSIQEAALLMARHSLSSIIVTNKEGIPAGIVTDRDICEKIAAAGRSFKEPIGNIRTLPLIRVDAAEYCIEVVAKMINHNMTSMVVVEDGRLKGVLTNHDIIKLLHLPAETEKAAPSAEPEGFTNDAAVTLETSPLPFLRVIQFIQTDYSKDITLETLAGEANMSKYHFCRFFSRFTGMSPMKYVVRVRIDNAKELLSRTELTLSEVSSMVGFKDPRNFTRQFKKITGVTAAAYRTSHGNVSHSSA